MRNSRKPVVLLVEDDADDRMLALRAFDAHNADQEVRVVEDGEELMAYLRADGKYATEERAPRPDLILLDLNLPLKDGREALQEIKSDPHLRQIPIVVLTTSAADADITSCYDAGANAYLTKPSSFKELQHLVDVLGSFWLKHARLPS